jgi:MFS family permease
MVVPTSLWRNRDYLLLWSGQSVSAIGSRVSGIVFPLVVLDLTHSAALAGLVGALSDLPYAVFGLPAGALVDRWNRKRVMLLCDTLRALNMASIPLALAVAHLTVGQLFAVAALEGTLFTFYDIAQNAALPQVVAADQLPAALARSHGMVGTAQLIGPPLGGLLLQTGRAVPFVVDALSYAASVGSLLFIKTPFQQERSAAPGRLRTEIAEGLTWIWRQRFIRFTGLMAATDGMVFTGLGLTLIVLARQQHATPATIGTMFAVAAVGGTAGSFITGWIVERFTFPQILIGAAWLTVLLWPLYLILTAPLLLGTLLGIHWMISGGFHLAQGSYRRILVPDELQGRVNGVFELLELSADVVAVALTGVLLQAIGIKPVLLVLFAALIVQAVIMTLSPLVRHAPARGQMGMAQ